MRRVFAGSSSVDGHDLTGRWFGVPTVILVYVFLLGPVLSVYLTATESYVGAGIWTLWSKSSLLGLSLYQVVTATNIGLLMLFLLRSPRGEGDSVAETRTRIAIRFAVTVILLAMTQYVMHRWHETGNWLLEKTVHWQDTVKERAARIEWQVARGETRTWEGHYVGESLDRQEGWYFGGRDEYPDLSDEEASGANYWLSLRSGWAYITYPERFDERLSEAHRIYFATCAKYYAAIKDGAIQMSGEHWTARRFLPVLWGERQYLIEERDRDRFVGEAAALLKAGRDPNELPLCYLVKFEDRDKPAFGKPKFLELP